MGTMELEKSKQAIYSEDLSEVVSRLIAVDGWKKSDALDALEQYRNYLFLRRKYPEEILPPSKDIDEVWHAHILHTEKYRKFCAKIFADLEGSYLDHSPLSGQKKISESQEQSFNRMLTLYQDEFGKPLHRIIGRPFVSRVADNLRDRLLAKFPRLLKVVEG